MVLVEKKIKLNELGLHVIYPNEEDLIADPDPKEWGAKRQQYIRLSR